MGSGYPDITWHGQRAWGADFTQSSRCIAFMLDGRHAKTGLVKDDFIYAAINMHWDMHGFALPGLPAGMGWHIAVNTDKGGPEDAWEIGKEPRLDNQGEFLVGPRSVVVLVGK